MKYKNFSKPLLTWYDQHGRKSLPWRKKITPYRVWVSEIMLQQTQVVTVIPYFERFMQQFPTIKTLAAAAEDEVLSLWTGLGYYSRARNLHRTAKIIVEKYQGKFPNDIDDLESLPGIGRSTAGAILAIAMNQATPILEGNVKRVLTRFNAIIGWPGTPAITKQLWGIATYCTSQTRPADYTQAIMDLGATICTRSKPACLICPLKKNCQAFALSKQHEFPGKNPAKKILPIKQVNMLLLKNQHNEVLLQKRSPTGIWGGLWSFLEVADNNFEFYCNKQNMKILSMKSWPKFRHTFSHFHLDITPVIIDIALKKNAVMDSKEQIWYNPKMKLSFGLAAPVKNLLMQLYSTA